MPLQDISSSYVLAVKTAYCFCTYFKLKYPLSSNNDFLHSQRFPLVSYVREPLFKPAEFFASRKTSIPSLLSGKATNGTQTPPDVAINATGIENPVTPDLLRGNVTGKDGFFDQQQKDSDDELVTHLRTKRRIDNLRKKPKKRFDSEGSASVSNELEEDNYIPEVRCFLILIFCQFVAFYNLPPEHF